MKQPEYTYCRFKILSEKESDLELSKKILAVINELESHNYEKKTIQYIGDHNFQNKITSNEILTYITKNKGDVIVFSNENKEFNIFLTVEICGDGIYDCLWFSFNALIDDFPNMPHLNSLLNLLKSLFNSFKGIYAYAEDEELLHVYFSKRSYDKILSQLPVDYQNLIPKPDLDALNDFNIPSHFPMNEIDITQVPNGFWWINFLCKKQIENLNLNSAEIDEWIYTEVINEECKMYVLTDTYLDIKNKEHLYKLQNLIEKTDLIHKQEKFIK